MSFAAGRIMLDRVKELRDTGETFAFETTLSTRSYIPFLKEAIGKGYTISLLFFWLESEELAIQRVKTRVIEGGHNIPTNVIRERFHKGLKNFFELYIPLVSDWMLINNTGKRYSVIAQGSEGNVEVLEKNIWLTLQDNYNG